MMGDRERCIQAQMDEYLSKPLQQNHLIQTILKCATLGGALTSSNRDRDITRQADAKAASRGVDTSQYLRPGRPNVQSHGSEVIRGRNESPAVTTADGEDPLSRARTSNNLSALPAGHKRKR